MKKICLVMSDYIPQHEVSRWFTLMVYENLRQRDIPVQLVLTGFDEKKLGNDIIHIPKTRVITGDFSRDDIHFMTRGLYPDSDIRALLVPDKESHNGRLQEWRTEIQKQYSRYYEDKRYLPISIIELSAYDFVNTEHPVHKGLYVTNSGNSTYLEYSVFNNNYNEPERDMTKILMPDTVYKPLYDNNDAMIHLWDLTHRLSEFSKRETEIEELANLAKEHMNISPESLNFYNTELVKK